MTGAALHETSIPDSIPVSRGKVRDVYDLGDHLIIVATDRISAFDWVCPNGIPDKGKILTKMASFWFDMMSDVVPNHVISEDLSDFPEVFQQHADQFEDRSMLVHKCTMFPVEFVIRGYLAGSGWREYDQSQTVCRQPLPAGLVESSKLPQPLYTPATKAEDGHDMNISPEEAAEIIGVEWNDKIAEVSQEIYRRACAYCKDKGIILCDTKFEFGTLDGELMLADEVLTPDSSRFWPLDAYEPGRSQASYDKQFVRDWLDQTQWNKSSPPPKLPNEIVAKTREKYVEAYRQLTGGTDF